jgi:hypothetical protein
VLTILANNNLLLKRAGCVCHHSIVGKRSVNETLSWTYDHMQRMIRRLRDISTILSCNSIITTRYASVSNQLVRRRSIVKCLSINLNNLLECFSVSDICHQPGAASIQEGSSFRRLAQAISRVQTLRTLPHSADKNKT